MHSYIALLRGINVSGHHKIKMAELKKMFENLNFTQVQTYIQSGNILFESPIKDTDNIQKNIVQGIEQAFGFSVKVLILTKEELTTIFHSNPFLLKDETTAITTLYVTLLNKEIASENTTTLDTYANKNEGFHIVGKTIYLHFPNGYSKTKLGTNLIENKLKVEATSRNWKTISKLVELSTQ